MASVCEFYEKDRNARFNGFLSKSMFARSVKTYATRCLDLAS